MKTRKLLSVLITVCMIVSCMVGMSLTASAADTPEVTVMTNGVVSNAGGTVSVEEDSVDPDAWKFTATPNEGYAFARWTYSDAVTGEHEITDLSVIRLTKNDVSDRYSNITAYFKSGTYSITYLPGSAAEGIGVTPAAQTSPNTFDDIDDIWAAGIWTWNTDEHPDFVGWKYGDTIYNTGDQITLTGNITVTAVWSTDDFATDDPGNENEENPDEDDDDDKIDRPAWAEKPEYKPSGASGTAVPEEKPADEDKPADEPKDEPQDDPQDDPQDEPQDRDNDKDNDKDDVEIPNDRDTGNDGTSTVVDGSRDTNENPHTGAALGGISVLMLAGAAMIVSKKRK